MPQYSDPNPVASNELIESSWGNEVVNIIGPVSTLWQPPPGVGGNIADRLFDLNARAAASTAQLASIQKQQAGAGWQSGSTVITTSPAGLATVTFPQPMSAIQGIIVNPSSANERWVVIADVSAWSATGFVVTVWRGDGSVSNANSLRISYWAFGTVA